MAWQHTLLYLAVFGLVSLAHSKEPPNRFAVSFDIGGGYHWFKIKHEIQASDFTAQPTNRTEGDLGIGVGGEVAFFLARGGLIGFSFSQLYFEKTLARYVPITNSKGEIWTGSFAVVNSKKRISSFSMFYSHPVLHFNTAFQLDLGIQGGLAPLIWEERFDPTEYLSLTIPPKTKRSLNFSVTPYLALKHAINGRISLRLLGYFGYSFPADLKEGSSVSGEKLSINSTGIRFGVIQNF